MPQPVVKSTDTSRQVALAGSGVRIPNSVGAGSRADNLQVTIYLRSLKIRVKQRRKRSGGRTMAKVNIMKLSNFIPGLRTHEGAPAKPIDVELQLRRSVLACLLWESQFYEDGVEIAGRIRELVPKVEPEKVASLAIEARTKMKLRPSYWCARWRTKLRIASWWQKRSSRSFSGRTS